MDSNNFYEEMISQTINARHKIVQQAEANIRDDIRENAANGLSETYAGQYYIKYNKVFTKEFDVILDKFKKEGFAIHKIAHQRYKISW